MLGTLTIDKSMPPRNYRNPIPSLQDGAARGGVGGRSARARVHSVQVERGPAYVVVSGLDYYVKSDISNPHLDDFSGCRRKKGIPTHILTFFENLCDRPLGSFRL